MDIIVDSDSNLGYETNGIFRRLFNLVFIPILNILPPQAKNLVRKSHKSVGNVVDNVTTHVALEVLYKKGHKHHTTTRVHRLFHWIWFNTNNSKALRNRMRLVKRELKLFFEKFNAEGKEISMLSIASGSARAVIESIAETRSVPKSKLSLVFLDKNPEALKYSEQLLKEYNLFSKNTYLWVNATAGSFLKGCNKDQFNIIEMVGLLDYFNDEKAVAIFSSIRNILVSGGVFITANINYNSEQRFLTRVVNWNMIYRSGEEFGKLLLKSGFKEEEIQLYYEPLRVHGIAVVTKK